MISLQQQYNLQPGQYKDEVASLSVLPHVKSVTAELASYIGKAFSGNRGARNKPEGNIKA